MASNKRLKISAHQKFIIEYESELRVLNMSDEEIKKKVCATHTHSDRNIDVASLFAVVKNILNPAIVAVENIVLVYIRIYICYYLLPHILLISFFILFLSIVIFFFFFFFEKHSPKYGIQYSGISSFNNKPSDPEVI